MAFGFKFAKDFSGELKIAFFEGLGGAQQPGPSALGIEKLDGLVAQRFVERVAEIAGARETMPGLFGHRFMQDPADGLAYG